MLCIVILFFVATLFLDDCFFFLHSRPNAYAKFAIKDNSAYRIEAR